MIDSSNLVPTKNSRTQYFVNNGTSTIYQPWTRPKKASMAMFILIGSGGGGGAGFSGASGTDRGGGGGGGSGSSMRMIIPARQLPRILYMSPGLPGLGGAASGSAGGSGRASFIIDNPTASGIAVASTGTLTLAGGGAAGSSSGAAAGGVSESSFLAAQSAYSCFGQWTAIAGQNGTNGGIPGGGGISLTPLGLGLLVTGGTGGAGVINTGQDGGLIGAAGLFPALSGGISGVSVNGRSGYQFFEPLVSYGGTGGGSSDAGVAGRGGTAGLGSGGGGGGAGVTGGPGGDGGGGLIIAIWW